MIKGDTLRFRIPGDEPVSLNGRFIEVKDFTDCAGFIISTFTSDRKYYFKEDSGLSSGIYFRAVPDDKGSKAGYLHAGQEILKAFSKGEASKVVLSRRSFVAMPVEPELLFMKLCEAYPEAFVYLVSSPLFGTWLGASPEVLLTSVKEKKYTVALAGTRKKDDPKEWSSKEINEHRFVVDHILNELNNTGTSDLRYKGPFEVMAGPVKHLKTEITFQCKLSDADLVNTLHPTPAVAGTPTGSALQLISQYEGYNRELYTGMIGLLGASSKVFVNLRCMQVYDSECALYIGGGWVAGSDPESEWIETENKARTLLRLMEMK